MSGTTSRERFAVTPERRATSSAWPFISVVMPVRNEEAYIRGTLEQLLGQNYDADRFEVIIADGQSSDATMAIVGELAAADRRVRPIDNPKRWSSAGRNLGIEAAVGEIIVIVDGHCDLNNPDYLREIAGAFARSGASCLGRPQPLDAGVATPVQRAIASARSSRLGHHPASFIYSGREQFVRPHSVAVAYRRSVFDTVGSFDETFDACEDVELNHRVACAGLRCFFTPRIQARYYPRSSLTGLFQQMHRYGRGRARLLRKHPATFSLPGFLPAFFVMAIVGGAVLSFFSSVLASVYLGSLACYAAVVAIVSLIIAIKSRDLARLPWLPPAFVAIHGGAGVGILRELGTPGKRGDAQGTSSTARRSVARIGLFSPATAVGEAPQAHRNHVLNALTVDVEDYYQVSGFESCVKREHWHQLESRVEASTEKVLASLDRADVQATFFVLGWVAERYPGLVRAIAKAGHEIGCHSFWHHLVYTQSPAQFRKDLRQGRDVLSHITGTPVRAFRAPSFSITERSLWALDVLIEEGFNIDSSVFPTHHDRYGMPGAPCRPHRIHRPAGEIWEFPMAVYRALGYPVPVGGGGYFRLFPYAVTAHALRAINREGRPFVFYLHPWELDPGQPRFAPGRLRSFRHYVNIHRTEERLHRLLRDFNFGSISQVLAGLDHRREGDQRHLPKAA